MQELIYENRRSPSEPAKTGGRRQFIMDKYIEPDSSRMIEIDYGSFAVAIVACVIYAVAMFIFDHKKKTKD